MTTFQVLQTIIFSYVGISIILAIFLWYFKIKYFGSAIKERWEMRRTLEKLRGRNTILLPLQVYSWIFLIVWFSLILTFIDFFFQIHILSQWQDNTNTLITWFGTFAGKKGDILFITMFVGMLGAKGFFVLHYMASVLRDKTLAVNRAGSLDYHRQV